MNLFSDLIALFNNNFLVAVLSFQILANLVIIFSWRSKILRRFHGVYQAEQKIHDGFVPRFGGLVMIIILIIIANLDLIPSLFIKSFSTLLWCLSPLIFVTILEDVYNNIHPRARLVFIFISAVFIFIFFEFNLPIIDIPILANLLINYPFVLTILLIISLASMVNAFNLIDGANGLLLFSFLSILFCLKLMSIEINSEEWVLFLNLLISICLVQFLFNFPKAFIFCGDLGAYSFGFLLALLVIIFFGQYPSFVTWQAVLILFYPAWELIFTVLRRGINNKNPLIADNLHLHHFIFNYLKRFFKKNYLANSLTTLFLFPIWGFALFWLFIHGSQLELKLTLIGITLNLFLYLTTYFIFTKLATKENLL
jgi:UDP-GlcNAc:undecaprenyl-phosphate GlcNAc-1-phosphate transferase